MPTHIHGLSMLLTYRNDAVKFIFTACRRLKQKHVCMLFFIGTENNELITGQLSVYTASAVGLSDMEMGHLS